MRRETLAALTRPIAGRNEEGHALATHTQPVTRADGHFLQYTANVTPAGNFPSDAYIRLRSIAKSHFCALGWEALAGTKKQTASDNETAIKLTFPMSPSNNVQTCMRATGWAAVCFQLEP